MPAGAVFGAGEGVRSVGGEGGLVMVSAGRKREEDAVSGGTSVTDCLQCVRVRANNQTY
jgi:hypothetical protein